MISLPARQSRWTAWLNENAGLKGPPAKAADPLSDESLVEQFVRHGQDRHFEMLVSRYKQHVFRVALSVLGPSAAAHAEDAAQEAFVRAYRSLHRFRGDSRFSTWLYRIAYNTAIDMHRRQRRFDAEIQDNEFLAALPAVRDTGGVEPAVAQRISSAMETLPTSQRMMLRQYYWLDMKIAEIAHVMACPEGTVKVYLKRGREALARALAGIDDD
ncbi:MAG: RNA polymerase sigma factor [Xanthomonadales bacterium]|nr:RNA polymerase sigma factor [Xanthomonadales bacterium]